MPRKNEGRRAYTETVTEYLHRTTSRTVADTLKHYQAEAEKLDALLAAEAHERRHGFEALAERSLTHDGYAL